MIVGAGVPAKYFSIAEHGWPGSTGEIASSVFERSAKYVSTRDQVKEATDRLIEGVKEFFGTSV